MNFFTVLFSVFFSIQQAFIQLVPTIQPKSSWKPRHVKPLARITIENCLSCRSIHTHTWVELVQSSHSHMPQWVLQRLSSSHSKVRWPIVKHQKRTLLESDLKKVTRLFCITHPTRYPSKWEVTSFFLSFFGFERHQFRFFKVFFSQMWVPFFGIRL